MLVSVSRSCAEADNAHSFFDTVRVEKFRQLVEIICGDRRWSPIVWANGRRAQVNFQVAQLVVLDFDNGHLSVEGAVKHFTAEGVRFLVGLTKSHGIPKGDSPAQDRFRVVLQMDRPLTDLKQYKQNMRRILRAYPADQACGDGARIYRPCSKVVALNDGESVAMLPYEEPPPPVVPQLSIAGVAPRWVQEVLSRDCPGQRNSTVFRVAARLKSYGFEALEIRRIIASSAISLPPTEMEAAIESGCRAVRN